MGVLVADLSTPFCRNSTAVPGVVGVGVFAGLSNEALCWANALVDVVEGVEVAEQELWLLFD